MRSLAFDQRPALTTALLSGGTITAVFLLWGAGSPLSTLARLDLSFLALPLTLWGGLLVLGRLVLLLRGTEVAERITLRLRDGSPGARLMTLAEALPVVYRVLTDISWVALGLGLLSSVSALPGVISDHPWAPDIASLAHYMGGFDSLAIWGLILLTPFIVARAVAETRPEFEVIIGFPLARLAAFGASYVLLGDEGALSAAFGLDGVWALLVFGLALALSYAASVIRRVMIIRPPKEVASLRTALYSTEAAWILTLWTAAALLALAAENASPQPSAVGAGSLDTSYVVVLHSLSIVQALAVVLPISLIHAARALWPEVDRILGAPFGHLALLAVAYIVFSHNGVLATAFAVDFSGMLAVLIVATILIYTAAALRNAAKIGVRERYGLLTENVLRVLSALVMAATLAVALGAALAHLPGVTAVLLDHSLTRELGQEFLPLLGGFYETRYSMAWLSFAAAATVLLMPVMKGQITPRYSIIMSAVSYFALGCLIWLVASGLSAFGHGLILGGAIVAAGMFSLALTRLAALAAESSSPTVAFVAGWLAASRVRGFVFGSSVAFYMLLLRPVFYEVLGLAALYEYIALLLLSFAVLMLLVDRMRVITDPLENAEPSWSHHQQSFESKVDPRAVLTDSMRQRFLDHGDWRPLWIYLFWMLYRNEASLDVMAEVCRSLRHGGATPLVWNIFYCRRKTFVRTAALQYALDTAGRALTSSAPQLEHVDEHAVRRAGASYSDSGTDPEPLAVALSVAHCQQGGNAEEAAARWFSLLDTSFPFLGWLTRQWNRSGGRPRTTLERIDFVNKAIAALFGNGAKTTPSLSNDLAETALRSNA